MAVNPFNEGILAAGINNLDAAKDILDNITAAQTDAAAAAAAGVPTGGTDGQVLTKTSSTDYATAWEDAGGGGGGTPSETVILTHAQILELDDTPVTIVPAAGANKVIVPLSAVAVSDFAEAYADPVALKLAYADNDIDEDFAGTNLFVAGSVIATWAPAPQIIGNPTANNVDLTVRFTSTAPTGGHADNTLTVTVYYQIFDVPEAVEGG